MRSKALSEMKSDNQRRIFGITGREAADTNSLVDDDNNMFWPGLTERELGNISFDAEWYLNAYPDLTFPDGASFTVLREHYLRWGAAEGRQPNNFFREDWYKDQYSDVLIEILKGKFVCGYHHYLLEGVKRNYQPTNWFDERWYRSRYPDVAHAIDAGKHLSGFDHFVMHGMSEGRIPNAAFNRAAGLRAEKPPFAPQHIVAIDEGVNPTPRHDVTASEAASRLDASIDDHPVDFHAVFDPEFYRATYADVRATAVDPLHHYLAVGANEGRNPCILFDTDWYLENYSDV